MLQVETGRRDFLTFLGLLTGLSAAQAAKAADPYEVGGHWATLQQLYA
jgi:hypothetical protein